jgi:hypothetical protein
MADQPTRLQKTPTASFSPTPGCILFIIGGLAIVTLVCWFFYAGWKQAQEIKTFTDETSIPVKLPAVDSAQLTATQSKLAAYHQAVIAKQSSSVSLTVAELNMLLAGDSTLASVKDLLMVSAITDAIQLTVSFPLNGIGQKRFLNGQIQCKPVVKPSTGLAIITEQITVPGKNVTPGFVNLYREMNILDDMLLKAYREHPELGAALKATTSVSLESGSVVLKYESSPPKVTP